MSSWPSSLRPVGWVPGNKQHKAMQISAKCPIDINIILVLTVVMKGLIYSVQPINESKD